MSYFSPLKSGGSSSLNTAFSCSCTIFSSSTMPCAFSMDALELLRSSSGSGESDNHRARLPGASLKVSDPRNS